MSSDDHCAPPICRSYPTVVYDGIDPKSFTGVFSVGDFGTGSTAFSDNSDGQAVSTRVPPWTSIGEARKGLKSMADRLAEAEFFGRAGQGWGSCIEDIQRRISGGSAVRLDLARNRVSGAGGATYTIKGSSIPADRARVLDGQAVAATGEEGSAVRVRKPRPAVNLLERAGSTWVSSERTRLTLPVAHSLAGEFSVKRAEFKESDEFYEKYYDEWKGWVDDLEKLMTKVTTDGGWIAIDLRPNCSVRTDDARFPYRPHQWKAT